MEFPYSMADIFQCCRNPPCRTGQRPSDACYSWGSMPNAAFPLLGEVSTSAPPLFELEKQENRGNEEVYKKVMDCSAAGHKLSFAPLSCLPCPILRFEKFLNLLKSCFSSSSTSIIVKSLPRRSDSFRSAPNFIHNMHRGSGCTVSLLCLNLKK